MHRYLIGFSVTIALLILLGIFAVTQLEIYQKSKAIAPSREAFGNACLAMERWLAKTGHPVRIESGGNPRYILAAREKTVYVQASCFDWSGEVQNMLEPWVSEGGVLVLSVDSPWYEEGAEGLRDFLTYLGIERINPEDQSEEIPGEPQRPIPYFDWSLAFKVKQNALPKSITKVQTMSDEDGVIRLVRLSLDKGSVTVIGVPYFMYFDSLRKEENARLSWNLLGTQTGSELGVLFIRDKKAVKRLWGKLAERGNIFALGVSILVLLVIGFWMVIPVFGLLLDDPVKPGKPIRERFLAEARFLKKYGALETYLMVYVREIKLKLRKRAGFPEGESPQELAEQIRTLSRDSPQGTAPSWDLTVLTNALEPKKHLKPPDLVKYSAILKKVLEGLLVFTRQS
jgi:hypothetical protein